LIGQALVDVPRSRPADGGPVVAATTVPCRPADARTRPLSAFTVDVEDWYQSCVDFDAPITERVVRNVDRILELLDESGVRGTFFVQGLVAEAFPRMVEALVAAGHEVQSHGYSHRPLYAMSRAELRDELARAKTTVEDAAGAAVTAFRAQDFSILAGNLWALEVLADVGFTVDSSIFPVRTKRYGIAGWEVAPHRLELAGGASVLEVPVAIWTPGRWRVPVAGGGYFRVLPSLVLERALRAIVAAGRPPVVYCHPYEFNPDELEDYAGRVPRRLLRSQNLGRRAFVPRLRKLFARLEFGRFDDVLAAWGIA
jgi:polysaccharide deacetylase family protein (PEP-CTERM system associated)